MSHMGLNEIHFIYIFYYIIKEKKWKNFWIIVGHCCQLQKPKRSLFSYWNTIVTQPHNYYIWTYNIIYIYVHFTYYYTYARFANTDEVAVASSTKKYNIPIAYILILYIFRISCIGVLIHSIGRVDSMLERCTSNVHYT